MSVMSTILLESQTLVPFKPKVTITILDKNNLIKFFFRYFVEERGQRAGVGGDHRGGDCGGCVAAAANPQRLLLFLPEVKQRWVGRQSGLDILHCAWVGGDFFSYPCSERER